MEFVRCLPSLIARERSKEKESSQQMAREAGPPPSLHSEDTATEETHSPGVFAGTTGEDDVLVRLKSYATKVYTHNSL